MTRPVLPLVTYNTSFRPSPVSAAWYRRIAKHSAGTVTLCTVTSAAIVAVVATGLQTSSISRSGTAPPDAVQTRPSGTPSGRILLPLEPSGDLIRPGQLLMPKAGLAMARIELKTPARDSSASGPAQKLATDGAHVTAETRDGETKRVYMLGGEFGKPSVPADQIPIEASRGVIDAASSPMARTTVLSEAPPSLSEVPSSLIADNPGGEIAAAALALSLKSAEGSELVTDAAAAPPHTSDEAEAITTEGDQQTGTLIARLAAQGNQDTGSDDGRGSIDLRRTNRTVAGGDALSSRHIPDSANAVASGSQRVAPLLPAPPQNSARVRRSGADRLADHAAADRPAADQQVVAASDPNKDRAAGKPIAGGIEVANGKLVSIQLSELIGLLEARMDKPLFVWLKTSSAAERFVTPETLAKAGISSRFDESTGQLILTAAGD